MKEIAKVNPNQNSLKLDKLAKVAVKMFSYRTMSVLQSLPNVVVNIMHGQIYTLCEKSVSKH